MSDVNLVSIAPALCVVGAAAAIMAVELAFRSERIRSILDWVAYAGIAGALYSVYTAVGAVQTGFGGAVASDDLSRFVSIAILSAAFLAVMQAPGYMAARGVYRAEFFSLVLLASSGMLLLVQARELITLFLSLELMSLAVYVLVGITRRDARSNEAAVKYLVQGAFATGFLLYGMALLYGDAGSLHLQKIGEALSGGILRRPMAMAGAALFLAGFAFKLGAVPFHFWVPDVYEGAPTVVTSFMSVAVKAACFGAVARFLAGGLTQAENGVAAILSVLAALTMVGGNLGALAQQSVKRMLAYSSIAHTGYALIGLAVACTDREGAAESGASTLIYVFVYTFMTLGAFAFLAWMGRAPSPSRPHGRDAEDLADLAGLARRRPWAAAIMTVFMLSLAGLPPTAGFIGKFVLFGQAITKGFLWLAIVGILTSILSLYYYLRVVMVMYMQEPSADEPEGSPDFNIAIVAGVCALATLIFGLWPGRIMDFARAAFEGLLRS